jgi:hypothetical protein
LERFDGTPVKGIIVYPALIEQREDVRLASVDPLTDPRAVTDAEGRFQVINLKPGEYALAMQSPVGIIMPYNSEGQIVTFELTADATTELGNLPVGYQHPDSE